jgi:hypothetical protein
MTVDKGAGAGYAHKGSQAPTRACLAAACRYHVPRQLLDILTSKSLIKTVLF